MANKKYTYNQEQLAKFAKAMGHPARIAILQFLSSQNSCFFGDIHEVLPIAKATASQHLKELKKANLINGEVEAPKVKYCINRDNWKLVNKLFTELFDCCCCKKHQNESNDNVNECSSKVEEYSSKVEECCSKVEECCSKVEEHCCGNK